MSPAAPRFLVALNPEPNSRLPYLVRLPIEGGLVLKVRDTWPRTARVCYRSTPQVADELGARSISMPAISAGTFGFPIDATADVALRTVRDHLLGECQIERDLRLPRRRIESFSRRLRTM